MDLYLIYRQRDKGEWVPADYLQTDHIEKAYDKMEEVRYRDFQPWLSNRIVSKFDPTIYVPVFGYKVRKIIL